MPQMQIAHKQICTLKQSFKHPSFTPTIAQNLLKLAQ